MKQGDKCKVRMLATGEVVEAVYDGQCQRLQKSHFLKHGDRWLIALGHALTRVEYGDHECRFIGNAGVRE